MRNFCCHFNLLVANKKFLFFFYRHHQPAVDLRHSVPTSFRKLLYLHATAAYIHIYTYICTSSQICNAWCPLKRNGKNINNKVSTQPQRRMERGRNKFGNARYQRITQEIKRTFQRKWRERKPKKNNDGIAKQQTVTKEIMRKIEGTRETKQPKQWLDFEEANDYKVKVMKEFTKHNRVECVDNVAVKQEKGCKRNPGTTWVLSLFVAEHVLYLFRIPIS